MKDAFDKLKIISDVVKDNKFIFIMLLTSLGSLVANAGQYIENVGLELSKQTAIHEVARGFQSVMAEIEPKRTTKRVVIKQNCSKCTILLNSHIKEHH